MYHLQTKPIKRSSGRSSVAASAYRNGISLTDSRTGLTHDYSRKQGIVASECFMIGDNDQLIKIDNARLWDTAESKEKRKDARTAREIIINLPHEMDDEQRHQLVKNFSLHIAKKYHVAIDFAIHRPDRKGDQRNHHSHILMTTRTARLDNDGQIVLDKKTALELSNSDLVKQGLPLTKDQITEIRQAWQNICNQHLAQANINISIDCRSYKDRGIEQVPTRKLGHAATAMERKGIVTIKGDYNRQINSINQLIEQAEINIDWLKQEQEDEYISAYQRPKPTPKAATNDEPTTPPEWHYMERAAEQLPHLTQGGDSRPQYEDEQYFIDIVNQWSQPYDLANVKYSIGDTQPQPRTEQRSTLPADSQIIITTDDSQHSIALNSVDIINTLADLQYTAPNAHITVQTANADVARYLEHKIALNDDLASRYTIRLGNETSEQSIAKMRAVLHNEPQPQPQVSTYRPRRP